MSTFFSKILQFEMGSPLISNASPFFYFRSVRSFSRQYQFFPLPQFVRFLFVPSKMVVSLELAVSLLELTVDPLDGLIFTSISGISSVGVEFCFRRRPTRQVTNAFYGANLLLLFIGRPFLITTNEISPLPPTYFAAWFFVNTLGGGEPWTDF